MLFFQGCVVFIDSHVARRMYLATWAYSIYISFSTNSTNASYPCILINKYRNNLKVGIKLDTMHQKLKIDINFKYLNIEYVLFYFSK